MTLQPGTMVDGRYRVERLLSRGGMGTVFLGWDLLDERSCAIKCLDLVDPAAVQQFAVEVDLLRRVRSPRLPRVYAHVSTSAVGPLLVMEYIDGEDLETRVAAHGPLDEHLALTYTLHVLEALIFLHSQRPSILHRDVKPANIRVDQHGNAWLLDLGIGGLAGMPTAPGARAMTPAYAPPEQIQ